jgi:uncharacterized protein (TIGR02996 family)
MQGADDQSSRTGVKELFTALCQTWGMLTDDVAFLKAIAANRDDDTPRLTFSDWLDDQAEMETARTALIRTQCQLAWFDPNNPTPGDRETIATLTAQEQELLGPCRDEWLTRVADLGVTDLGFVRGMPEAATMPLASFLLNGAELSEQLPTILGLNLSGQTIQDAGAIALAASEHLSGLTSLNLGWNGIGPTGAEAIAASEHLSGLTSLNLTGNGIGPTGAEAIAASSHLSGLTSLDLGRNDIGKKGLQALASSPVFPKAMHIKINEFEGTFEEFQEWERRQRLVNPAQRGGLGA